MAMTALPNERVSDSSSLPFCGAESSLKFLNVCVQEDLRLQKAEQPRSWRHSDMFEHVTLPSAQLLRELGKELEKS
ncbi:hypothetical protein NECAME_11809 [Necator americanus]|uniref:Uncharacterized protein n=1 Tax=Necator americanus TaxID=51031 RepID=W2T5J2_NECAM|nr:hypothetical protein NECAME_11809 [Necator americanus]ETN76242.1 hypothetical protein NECAME_11809 [Necator americanus]